VIVVDGEKLRAACEADHHLGYELLKRFAVLMADRLNSARRAAIQYYTGG
jgi:CRP/FNR family cyclic AMP-dependent transcriptional regulator